MHFQKEILITSCLIHSRACINITECSKWSQNVLPKTLNMTVAATAAFQVHLNVNIKKLYKVELQTDSQFYASKSRFKLHSSTKVKSCLYFSHASDWHYTYGHLPMLSTITSNGYYKAYLLGILADTYRLFCKLFWYFRYLRLLRNGSLKCIITLHLSKR